MSPQIKEAPGSHNLSDVTNIKYKASNNGEEAQRAAPGSTNPTPNHNTLDVQGSKQQHRHHPEQEREVGQEGFPGETRPNQVPKRGQGPPPSPKAQNKVKGPWMPPGAAHGRDLARQRAIDNSRPQWQRCLDGIREKSGEERDPPGAGEFKDKRVTGQEPSRSPKDPQEVELPKSLQEQERTASIRRAYPSQPKEAPEAKRQAGAGL